MEEFSRLYFAHQSKGSSTPRKINPTKIGCADFRQSMQNQTLDNKNRANVQNMQRLKTTCAGLTNVLTNLATSAKLLDMQVLLTPTEVRQAFDEDGVSLADWAKTNGFAPGVVYAVLSGRVRGTRGEAHRVAVALGLRPQPSGKTQRFSAVPGAGAEANHPVTDSKKGGQSGVD